MKIETIEINNFRSFKHEVIQFDNYTCFVGANGAGKSTVLYALNLFFRENKDSQTNVSKLSEDDFHYKNTDEPIEIIVTFNELSQRAKDDLKDYVRQDKLIISAVAVFDKETGQATVKQHGNRLVFESFRVFFEAEKNKNTVTELKGIYAEICTKYPDLPAAGTKAAMIDALQAYEDDHPEECSLVPSEDQFYGVSRGANKLAPHVQWVFVSASKNVQEECEETKVSALGQLLARTVRSKVNFSEKVLKLREDAQKSYEIILNDEQPVLDELSTSLSSRLKDWSHPDVNVKVKWKQDPDRSVKVEEPLAYINLGENGFDSDLSRFGHGLQRSYMLALLQELVTNTDTDAPTLIMAIEEPELYQHPPQARHLASVLYDLSQNNSQIMVCSHSPQFILADDFEAVRVVRDAGTPKATNVTQINYEQLAEDLKNAGAEKIQLKEAGIQAKLFPVFNPALNEMFFCNKLILVEGIEDVSYLTTYLILSDNEEEFRKNGGHIVPVNGKSNIVKPLAMAKLLGIPTFIIFDADTDKEKIPDENRRNSEVGKHKKDNSALLSMCGSGCPPWPTDNTIEDNVVVWKTNITDLIHEEIGQDWATYLEKAFATYGNASGLKKNPLVISHALELAWNDGKKSNLLLDVIEKIKVFNL